MVTLNEVGHDPSLGGDGLHGGMLVIAHEPAVGLDIGAENGAELSLDVFRDHGISLAAIKKPPGGYEYPPEALVSPSQGNASAWFPPRSLRYLFDFKWISGKDMLHAHLEPRQLFCQVESGSLG
jgi:hypothetical protein